MDSHNDIRNLIRRAVVTGGADNTKNFAVQQVAFASSVSDCEMLFPYGMYANATSPEKADSLVAMFAIEGIEEQKLGIPYAPLKRPKDLEQGEVAFYHPDTNSFIKFRNNGDLEIESGGGGKGNIIINCNDLTANVTNDATITTGGKCKLDAAGDVDIDAAGNITLDATLIQNNGTIAGVVTTLSINPLTGLPFPNGSPTVRAGDG